MKTIPGLVVAAITFCTGVACAQERSAGPAPTMAHLMALKEPERTATLAAGARREGVLNWYTSMQSGDIKALSQAFEKKYGVKITAWRSSTENVVQRVDAEHRANRSESDVYELGGKEMETLHIEKFLEPLQSPAFSELIPEAVLPHHEWIGTRINTFVAAYNTSLVKKADLPKSYEDLTKPRWKGQLAVEADDYDWFASVIDYLGETKGLSLFREIVAKSGLQARKGHSLLTNLVASGEVPLALTNNVYKVVQLKGNGAPIDWFMIPPATARVAGMGLAKDAPHPNASILFLDFMLTDGQKILAARDFWVTNRKFKTVPDDLTLHFTDPGKMLAESEKWSKLFQDVLNKQ